MDDAGLEAILRQRLLEAAIDHPDLQAVLYCGPSDAFPSELFERRFDRISWPLVNPSDAIPAVDISSFLDSHSERTEVLAFFGTEAALSNLRRLARSAIDECERYRTPELHKQSQFQFPERAWVRWLFDWEPGRLKRRQVHWHREHANRLAHGDLGDRPSIVDANCIPDRLREELRDQGCIAAAFLESPFAVSAYAMERPIEVPAAARARGSSQLAGVVAGTRFLDLNIDQKGRTVTRCGKERSLEHSSQLWKLFLELSSAGRAGRRRADLVKALWGTRAVTPNALDQLKSGLNELLTPLGIAVEAEGGTWLLAELNPSLSST